MPGNLTGRTDGRTCRKTVTVGQVDQRTHVQVKRGYFRLRTDGRLREKHNCIVMRIDEDSSAYSESFKSGVYQLGVQQGQGDSSAPSTADPLICGFCLVPTPNTRGETVEESIVTWMFAREFITNNRHPGEPQLTNKPCTNRTDGQPENIMPPAPKGIKTNVVLTDHNKCITCK